jgi:hypothetical protein
MTPKPKLRQGEMTENERRAEVAQRIKARKVGKKNYAVPVCFMFVILESVSHLLYISIFAKEQVLENQNPHASII